MPDASKSNLWYCNVIETGKKGGRTGTSSSVGYVCMRGWAEHARAWGRRNGEFAVRQCQYKGGGRCGRMGLRMERFTCAGVGGDEGKEGA